MAGRARAPLRLVKGDRDDGSTAEQVGVAGVEPVAAPDEHARSEGGVGLVPRERQVVNAEGGDVHPAVRNELGAVDGDAGSAAVSERGKAAQRQHLPGDVGGAGHGQERGRACGQFGIEQLQRVVKRCGRAQHPGTGCPADPWQQVGVVFEVENDGFSRGDRSEQVEGVGGVAGEDDGVSGSGPDEVADHDTGVLVDGGADLRGVAGATVHARVERQHLGNVRRDDLEGGRRRRIVEVDVAGLTAADERHAHLAADHGDEHVTFATLERSRFAVALGT